MFDHVVLNRSIDGPSITIGEIAEALLFYQSIHIILDRSTLASLIDKIGSHNILKLLSLPHVKATYIEEFLGVHTEQTPFGPEHMLVSAYVSGGQDSGELKSVKKRLEYMLLQNKLSRNQAENFISRFKNLVTFRTVVSDHFIKGGIVSAAMNDLSDIEYVSSGSRIISKNLLASNTLPDDYHFRIIMNNGKFKISTNLDFSKINDIQSNKHGKPEKNTPESIVSGLFNASYGLILAAHYGGDFYTSEVESEIIQFKNKQILNRTNINRSIQNNFYTILLDGCPDVATVLNSDDRSFEEFLELLSKAEKFKKWLKGKSPDENLISNYIDDITSSGWINKTPVKFFRYLANTGIGFINPVAGVFASAVDTFVLDKLNLGWKPNQFINGKLKKFVDND
ncbi:hypothetical protein [Pectobacterium aroidearum]|uniref:hypothetical protein n=1 Tax=Pectobacterium aroidearum TaxID=1201031 RepID=UPI0026253804|nr:hypothetical protein [Pectobacterium aroidearum]WKA62790.1 hypothetical protein QX495_01215 [Pectobacterium aroidearum]